MPDRCTVYGCSNTNSIEKGISLHRIPFWEDQRPEAKKRRKKWVKFVESKRQKWTPSSSSVVCSDHFLPEDYETFYVLPVSGKREYTPRLKKDAFGIAVYPTVYKVCEPPQQSDRSRRQDQRQTAKVTLKSQTVSTSTVTSLPAEQQACQQTEDIQPRPVASVPSGREPDILSIDPVPDEPELQVEDVVVDEGNHPKCGGCVSLTMEVRELKRRTRQLRNNWLGSRFKLNKCRQLLSSTKTPKRCECNCSVHVSEPAESEIPPTELEVEDYEMESEQEDVEITEEEPENDYHADATDTDTTETDTDDDEDGRVYIRDDNIRTQPKYMVFLTHLLLLFKFCPFCKEDNPLVETKEVGTAAVVTSMCTNPECSKEFVWHSQPKIPLTRIYAGNFLLCFSILLSGASPSKILQIFRHMGLACVSLKTYFAHQRKFLFPSILIYWKEYQRKMIDRLKSIGAGLVIAGDGRHDSMGHSAKYCAYTIFCCTVSMIIHFDLVQRNEAGSSPAMEYMAFNQCMTYLLGIGLGISTFISDRHTGIAKHMREKLGNIKHYFDLWHLKKSITKVLTKIARLSGFKAIADWIKPCGNHFYWSACSTHDGNGSVIWAKFKTFLSHIVNKHKDLADPLYNRCNHGPDISHRQWLLDDSDQYNKVYEALTNTKLESAIKKASPLSQTSCLEGFHSVLNQFAPKMFSYSYIGMFCRHVLAAVHFNSNLHREVRQRKDGSEQVKIVYPKFKNGEGTVRDVKKEPVFDYVEEIFQTTMDAIKEKKLDAAIQELKNTTPAPMNTMLEKQPRQEVLQKRDDRRRMSCNDVPPTTPVSEIASRQVDPSAATRSKPHCSVCKHPMKGHKQITTCPRNRPASPSTI